MWKEVNLLSTNFSAKHTPSATLNLKYSTCTHKCIKKNNTKAPCKLTKNELWTTIYCKYVCKYVCDNKYYTGIR